MKTIDLLVQELPALGGFPEGAVEAGFLCSDDTLYFVNKEGNCPSEWRISMNCKVEDGYVEVTREQYEAALAAKNDGWIEWGGGKIPVDNVTVVDIKFRSGVITSGVESGAYYWPRTGHESDIIAYRLHQPNKADLVRAAAWNAYAGITEPDAESDLNECSSQDAAQVWSGEGLPPVGCFCEVEDRDGMLVYGHGESGEVIAHVENTAVIRMSYGLGCFEAGFLRPLRTEAERKRDAVVEQMIKIATIHTTKSLGLDLALNSIYSAIAAGEITGVKLED